MTRAELKILLKKKCRIVEDYITVTCDGATSCIKLLNESDVKIVRNKLIKNGFKLINEYAEKPKLQPVYIEFKIPEKLQKKTRTLDSCLLELENSVKPQF